MSNADSKIVRQDIEDLLRSRRLKRLETVSAHIFKMYGREWRELTRREVLVHIFRDSLDDVDKILARDHFKLIFNFAPLSASFTYTCLSKKFVRLITNKFDRAAVAYGFGFSIPQEMEKFCIQLDRILNYARATLSPSLHAAALGIGRLEIRSPSTTPPGTILHRDNTNSPQGEYHEILEHSSAFNLLSVTSLNYAPSPYRQPLLTGDNYLPLATYNQTQEFSAPVSSTERFDCCYGSDLGHDFSFASHTKSVPMCEAPDLSKLPLPDMPLLVPQFSRQKTPEWSSCVTPVNSAELGSMERCESGVTPEDKLVTAERRLRALMDAIQPISVIDDIWNTSVEAVNECASNALPRATSRSENPADVIASPVKGDGETSPSHQGPKTWNSQ